MRRVRASIERTVLAPHNLLRCVLHFDGQQCDDDRLAPLRPPDSSRARCFLRFREPAAAADFVAVCKAVGTGGCGDSANEETQGLFAVLLEGEREKLYCAAIATEKAGVRERRRRQQAAKRQRQTKKTSTTTEEHVKETNMEVASQGVFPPKRIVFDE